MTQTTIPEMESPTKETWRDKYYSSLARLRKINDLLDKAYIAQLDRAVVSEAKGCQFNSDCTHQISQ